MSALSVVVVSWNTRELLRECLDALAPEHELIVVDNASADGSADMVAAEFRHAHLVRNEENEGFARAVNRGLELAAGSLVLLLNSDAVIEPGALWRLCNFLEEHPGHGAVAPRLLNPDGTIQRACMRFPRLSTSLWFGTPLERWFPRSRELERYFMRDFDHEDARDVEQPPAACLLLSRAALDVVGPLDERMWLFFNDVDLCLRLARAGKKIRYLPAASCVHHGGASTRRYAEFVPRWQADRLAYYRKHFGRAGALWLKLCVSWTFLDWSLCTLLRRLRGGEAEPLRPLARAFASFMRR